MSNNKREIYNYLQSHPNTAAKVVAEALPNIPSAEAIISKMKSKGILVVADMETYPLPQGGDGHRNLYAINPDYHDEPSAAATPSAQDSDPLAAVMNEQPQTSQNAPQSPSDTTDGQFTDDEAKSVYDEVIAARRYGQLPFSLVESMRQDIETGELSTSQLCQVLFYVADAMSDKAAADPTPQDIADPVVRLYVKQWLRSHDVFNADEYVGYIMQKQRHWKYAKKIGDKKATIDISETRWAQYLLEQYNKKK